MSMTSSIRTPNPVADITASAALLDTSAVIDLPVLLEREELPSSLGISTITLAELAAGPAAAKDPIERSRRQDRLQRVEATFEPIPFTAAAARAYGRVYAATLAQGRHPRRRFADLLIASVACAEGLPLITRNPDDFVGLGELVHIIGM